jgi:hypothetical protein
MKRAILLVALLAVPARAQPCDPCIHGDVLIDRFGLGAVRPLADQLAALSLSEPLSPAQYTKIVELRARTPILGRLGALDDTELALVAAALCKHPDNQCTTITQRALTCLADRCEVALPPDPKADDVLRRTEDECRPNRYTGKPSPRIGLGFDWGNGWQRSGLPNEGRAWNFGIEGRVRLGRRLGLVARADRSAGRDEATDADDNGKDDLATGSITRFSLLAGPSFVLDATRYERTTRFLRVDLLAGVLTTPSQPGEDGPAAGIDVAYQVSVFKLGLRFVQGLGEADSASLLLGHFGIAVGSVPPRTDESICPPRRRSSRLALGFELPLGGAGISEQLGYLATGLGVELIWHLWRRFDVVTHADLLLYPGNDRDRVIHHAVLGGLRIDHSKRKRRARTGWYSTLMSGYTHGAALANTTVGSGPVLDASLAWGAQDADGAGYIRLHGRFGLADNTDYRALFLAIGFELRFDPRRWRDRDRDYW